MKPLRPAYLDAAAEAIANARTALDDPGGIAAPELADAEAARAYAIDQLDTALDLLENRGGEA